jgi:NADPH:quinone reductase-like Zn-dependent oxidoreductase
MKAIYRDDYCAPEDLHFGDVDKPVAGPGEVLLKVHAAGVDQGVWHVVAGLPYGVRLGFGLRRPRSRVPGLDVAGTVVAVGAGVTAFQPGDEVFGTCAGSFAEHARAKATRLARKPARVTFEQAAAVPTSAYAALQGLRDAGRLRPGQRVLILGAGGGVGTFAVQLAKALGGTVTGVCGTEKTHLVKALGADQVIDYTQEPIDQRYDLIIDTGGNRPLGTLRQLLEPHGTLVIVGSENSGGGWLRGFDRQLRARLLSPFTRQRLRGLTSRPSATDLEQIARLIEAGALTPMVDRKYPLKDAAEALRHLRDGHATGKAVLTV